MGRVRERAHACEVEEYACKWGGARMHEGEGHVRAMGRGTRAREGGAWRSLRA